jgi:hypothetical protein
LVAQLQSHKHEILNGDATTVAPEQKGCSA